MGQQQLLLIVLGVIIVGIAVVVGINVFTASSYQANQDAVVADLTNLASMAQQHYRKPGALGGGGNSFDGTGSTNAQAWSIPPSLLQTANMGAAVQLTLGADEITLIGTGTEKDAADNPVTVTMKVGPNSILETTFGAAAEE